MTVDADPASLPGMGRYLITVVFALAGILGLAVGFLYLMKRFMPMTGGGRRMRVVESVSLEPRRALHLVQVSGRYLLVGSTDGSIRLIAELDPEQVDAQEPPSPPRRRFLDLLRGRGTEDGKDHS